MLDLVARQTLPTANWGTTCPLPSIVFWLKTQAPVETIANAISRNIQQLHEQSRLTDVGWWQAQLHWVERNRVELTLG